MTKAGHALEVREPHFDFSPKNNQDVFYDSGSLYLTFEWSALSLIIPAGERFFIRSVKKLAHRAKDPILQQQIDGFIGQEAMHAKETDRSLDPLVEMGYPIRAFEKGFDKFLRKTEKLLPWKTLHLAVTAGAEHYTAVLSIWHLRNRYSDRFPEGFRELTQWHGVEELEHKAVAFDLLQEIAPRNYLIRALGFLMGMAVVGFYYHRAMKMLLKHLGLSRKQIREERKKAHRIRIPLLSWRFPRLWEYLRPGYHPNHIDDGGLIQEVLARLGPSVQH